jgi:hypothetical protein
MLSSLLLDPNDSIIGDRLSRVQANINSLNLSTKEEYIAQIYSQVNSVLNLGDNMQELDVVTSRPAIVGDLITNFSQLNEDATDITRELLRIEDNLADLYNVAATGQNALKQALRETIYVNNLSSYSEPFISTNNISSGYTANIDINAGSSQLPLIAETVLFPTISLGSNCVGTGNGNLSSLLNSTVGFIYTWKGTYLELTIIFPSPVVANRLYLGINTYEGLAITELTSSPDGIIYNNILEGLPNTVNGNYFIDASSGKYSGDVVIDFIPVYTQTLKLGITNFTNNPSFYLNSLILVNRTYQSSGVFTSNGITLNGNNLDFSVDQEVLSPFTSITHQISTTGVQFKNIIPGILTGQILSGNPFYYRALLSRSSNAFANSTSALLDVNPTYGIKSQSSTTVSPGIIEQTIVLTNVPEYSSGSPTTTSVTFVNTPITNTFNIQIGSTYLTTGFDLLGNVLTFSAPQTLITITYQISSYSSVQNLQSYYTPLLHQVNFEVV